MPNYCLNTLILKGPRAVLKDIADHRLSFEHYVPVPDDIDARRTMWGTRSCPMDLEIEYYPDDPYTLKAHFMTAWSPPAAFLKTLLKRFPELWIKLEFKIEGGLGCGLWILYQEYGTPVERYLGWLEPFFSDSESEFTAEKSNNTTE
jgi:hypothetical protein